MTKCEKCEWSEIEHWTQDIKTGKATPEFWCELHMNYCDDILVCPHEPID